MADQNQFPGWVRYSGIGLELAGVVAVFTFIGYWIDGRYGSQPWGMIGGLILGFTGGLYNLVKAALRAEREAKIADDAGGSGKAGGSDGKGPLRK
jgi:F0F1-type ATP synthase assembly protein I